MQVGTAYAAFDLSTGLTWQRSPFNPPDTSGNICWGMYGSGRQVCTWQEAYQYCNSKFFYGFGWRLPTEIELLSIVDYTLPTPMCSPSPSNSCSSINQMAFQYTQPSIYWSSSPYTPAGTTSMWGVDFSNGSTNYYPALTEMHYVRCVR